MSERPTFTMTVRVTENDLDPQQHLNNVACLRFIQEAAVAHWLSAASPEVRDGILWVVRRHEVDYLKPGFLGEELGIRTWVGEPSGATWERFTEISRAADGVILVKSRTVWVLLDATTGRPRRVDGRITSGLR